MEDLIEGSPVPVQKSISARGNDWQRLRSGKGSAEESRALTASTTCQRFDIKEHEKRMNSAEACFDSKKKRSKIEMCQKNRNLSRRK